MLDLTEHAIENKASIIRVKTGGRPPAEPIIDH
jgi:hypothetical protein